jgi:hypothetical protein
MTRRGESREPPSRGILPPEELPEPELPEIGSQYPYPNRIPALRRLRLNSSRLLGQLRRRA